MAVFVVLFRELNMGRRKYNEGSSIKYKKNFTTIGSFNASVSGSVSGRRGQLSSRADFNISSPKNKWGVGFSTTKPQGGRSRTSGSISYTPSPDSKIIYKQNGNRSSLTFRKEF